MLSVYGRATVIKASSCGLSITRVVVVVFASLRGFMPVRDLYTLCSQRQEM